MTMCIIECDKKWCYTNFIYVGFSLHEKKNDADVNKTPPPPPPNPHYIN